MKRSTKELRSIFKRCLHILDNVLPHLKIIYRRLNLGSFKNTNKTTTQTENYRICMEKISVLFIHIRCPKSMSSGYPEKLVILEMKTLLDLLIVALTISGLNFCLLDLGMV